jgi:hypothetical protein
LMMSYQSNFIVKQMWRVKGEAISVQAWTGPNGCRRLRLPDLKTIGTRR